MANLQISRVDGFNENSQNYSLRPTHGPQCHYLSVLESGWRCQYIADHSPEMLLNVFVSTIEDAQLS